jgi:hypothetical protein
MTHLSHLGSVAVSAEGSSFVTVCVQVRPCPWRRGATYVGGLAGCNLRKTKNAATAPTAYAMTEPNDIPCRCAVKNA